MMVSNNIDSSKYSDWLKNEIAHYITYHDHKETMAWTATAFYVPAILALAYGARSMEAPLLGPVAFTVLACALVGVALLFVNMQFRMRWEADDISRGLRWALTRLYAVNPPLTSPELLAESRGWPKFVEYEINLAKAETKKTVERNWDCVDTLRRGEFCMGTMMFCRGVLSLVRLRLSAIHDSYKTELASYLAIILTSLVAISVVWVHYPNSSSIVTP
jgi:hypothetical protein